MVEHMGKLFAGEARWRTVIRWPYPWPWRHPRVAGATARRVGWADSPNTAAPPEFRACRVLHARRGVMAGTGD